MARMRVLLSVLVVVPVLAQEPRPQPRPAAEILRDYGRVAMPSHSGGADPESVARFQAAIADGCRRQADLAWELYRGHPDHARVPEVLGTRWAGLTNALGECDAVVAETRGMLATEGLRPDVALAARHALTHALMCSGKADNSERFAALRELLQADLRSELTGIRVMDFVQRHAGDPAVMRPLLTIAAEKWPDSGYVGRPAKRWLAVLAKVGEPFEAMLPEDVRAPLAAARGEAPFTVVQVWGGWLRNGEQDPELATLRELRAGGGGVAVVGLLHGNFDERLPVARKAGVDWPQLALPGRMPFGINRSPLYFVLDGEGRIVGVTGTAAAATARLRQLQAG